MTYDVAGAVAQYLRNQKGQTCCAGCIARALNRELGRVEAVLDELRHPPFAPGICACGAEGSSYPVIGRL
jgi:hypothetical protein